MIKLKKLRIKNFGSFKQEQVVDFPDSGLLLLHGENGSGKSSFLKAIAYCLDFLTEPASEFVNWDNQEDIFVELILSYKNTDMVIQRGNGFYKLEYGNVKTFSAETSKKIKELLLQPEFMSIMSYRGQNEEGNFSKLKPAEKQEFLSELQSLNDFEKLIDKTETNISILESNLEISKKDSQRLFENAQFLVSSIDNDTKIKSNIESEKLTIKASEDSYTLDTSSEDAEISHIESLINGFVIDTSMDKEIEEYKSKATNMSLEDKRLRTYSLKLIHETNTIANELDSLRKEMSSIDALKKQIETLKNSQCPTCEQSWNKSNELLEKSINKLIALESLTHSYKKAETRLADTHALRKQNDKQMQDFTDLGIEYMNKSESLRLQKESNNSKYNLYQKDLIISQNKKANIINSFNAKKNSFKEQLKQLDKRLVEIDTNIEKNTLKIQDLDTKIEAANNNVKSTLNSINKEKEILNSAKDFLRLITEDTLKLISAESSKYVQYLPNAKNFFINFDTSKLNKNGKIKKEIVLQIFKNGKEVPFRRLSGGEKCSVHLSTDLAVSKILSNRMGKNLGWFILDESLDGMRINNKIEALNMLKTLSKDKLIIIVDHTSEAAEVFDKVLNVTRKDSGSTLQFTS